MIASCRCSHPNTQTWVPIWLVSKRNAVLLQNHWRENRDLHVTKCSEKFQIFECPLLQHHWCWIGLDWLSGTGVSTGPNFSLQSLRPSVKMVISGLSFHWKSVFNWFLGNGSSDWPEVGILWLIQKPSLGCLRDFHNCMEYCNIAMEYLVAIKMRNKDEISIWNIWMWMEWQTKFQSFYRQHSIGLNP